MCGASSGMKSLAAGQSNFFNTIMSQAGSVFGGASGIFKDLVGAFAPIVAAGPNQHGFSDAERTAMNTQVTDGTAGAYNHAAKALSERQAAAGGGNVYIPKGADEQQQGQLLSDAASRESDERLGIVQADYAQGRQNFFNAAQGLEAAPGVFNAATSMDNAATGAGESAEKTYNDISQQDNSWISAVTGLGGALGGAAITSKLGKPCWVAAACFDGWDDIRTQMVREWLLTEFIRHWYGRLTMRLYMRFGERAAKRPRLVSMLRPLFETALRKAKQAKGE